MLTLAFSVPVALSVPIVKLEAVLVRFKVLPTPLMLRLALVTLAAAPVKLNVPVMFSVLPAPMLRVLAVEELLATAREPKVSVAPRVTELLPEASEPKTRLLAVVPLTATFIVSVVPLAELSDSAPVRVKALLPDAAGFKAYAAEPVPNVMAASDRPVSLLVEMRFVTPLTKESVSPVAGEPPLLQLPEVLQLVSIPLAPLQTSV